MPDGVDERSVEGLRLNPRVRLLLESDEVVLGEFHCGPEDPRWKEENCAEPGNLVVFPGTSVVIQHAGREPVVTGPNHLMLYNHQQTYFRRLLDPRGDHCVFLLVGPALLAEAAGEDAFHFSATHTPMSAAVYLTHRLVVRRLQEEQPHDLLEVEATLIRLISHAVRVEQAAKADDAHSGREGTRARHRRIVEETKALLAARVADKLTLREIARELHVSPFHLARLFRAQTGFALHEYRNQLRLRTAFERLFDPDVDLGSLALELGFASHSHFTDSFRRSFTLPPLRVRKMSKITEARALLPA